MQDYLKTRRELQLEGLSRIVQHSEQYDCAMISGYITEEDTPRKEQKRRHARLLAKLRLYNFFIISLKGAWKDKDGKIEKERSFFVVNKGSIRQEKEERMSLVKFSHTISKLGAEYRQESVLIVPRGALSGKSRAYLINMDAPTKKAYIGPGELGRVTGGMFSRVKRGSFTFGEEDDNGIKISGVHYPVGGTFAVMGYTSISKRKLKEVPTHILKGIGVREWIEEHDGNVYRKVKVIE